MVTTLTQTVNGLRPTGLMRRVLDGLDSNMTRIFMPWVARNPRYLGAALRLSRSYKRSEKLRKLALETGVKVPPFMILSITSSCNLSCAGCYAAAVGTLDTRRLGDCADKKPTMSWTEWRSIIEQANDLGVFSFIIAGGEPFLFRGLVQLCEEFNKNFFIILTNGTAISLSDYERLKKTTNVAVIVSVEGSEEHTDNRRGAGVYLKAMQTLTRLKQIGVPTGISVTITRENYEYWMQEENLDYFVKAGAIVGVFIEYIPVMHENITGSTLESPDESLSDDGLMLTAVERSEFRSRVLEYRQKKKSLYLIHSPGDEDFFGGCVSAGRGFAHITPTGDLTACPVSNLATHNLSTASLRDGLTSPLFSAIRENEHLLTNEDTPCALFAHPEEMQSIAESVGAYMSDNVDKDNSW
ncbi:MAG: radical SAM/SPASM domain-containing protein [Promethearchaeota archaeon]